MSEQSKTPGCPQCEGRHWAWDVTTGFTEPLCQRCMDWTREMLGDGSVAMTVDPA